MNADSASRRPHWTHMPTGTCDSPQDIPCYFHDAGKCRAAHKCAARNRKLNRDGQRPAAQVEAQHD